MRNKPNKPSRTTFDRQAAESTATLVRDAEAFSLRMDSFPLPGREFEAEAAWAQRRFGAVSLFFGKSFPGSDRVLQVSEIRLGFESFAGFWQNTGEGSFYDRFSEWAERMAPLDGGRPAIDTPPGELLSYAWFRATIVQASHVGSEAELNFYAIPVRSASTAIRDKGVNRVPLISVVRVTLAAHELHRLLADCRSIFTEIEPLLKSQPLEPREA